MIEKPDLAEIEAVKLQLAAGKSIRAVARNTGRSRDTVTQIKKRHESDIQEIQARLADSFFETAERALTHITDEKLQTANARDLGILSGVMTDKARLLSGESTQNVAVLSYFGGLIEAFTADSPEE
jgi:hypothetical protein